MQKEIKNFYKDMLAIPFGYTLRTIAITGHPRCYGFRVVRTWHYQSITMTRLWNY